MRYELAATRVVSMYCVHMTHYICTGECNGVAAEVGYCEADNCSKQWELLTECDCSDGLHGREQKMPPAFDANGAPLVTGDAVTLIKDLPLKGSGTVLKRGTKVSGIRLTDNPEQIDCKINGTAIVLRTEFVKKL